MPPDVLILIALVGIGAYAWRRNKAAAATPPSQPSTLPPAGGLQDGTTPRARVGGLSVTQAQANAIAIRTALDRAQANGNATDAARLQVELDAARAELAASQAEAARRQAELTEQAQRERAEAAARAAEAASAAAERAGVQREYDAANQRYETARIAYIGKRALRQQIAARQTDYKELTGLQITGANGDGTAPYERTKRLVRSNSDEGRTIIAARGGSATIRVGNQTITGSAAALGLYTDVLLVSDAMQADADRFLALTDEMRFYNTALQAAYDERLAIQARLNDIDRRANLGQGGAVRVAGTVLFTTTTAKVVQANKG